MAHHHHPDSYSTAADIPGSAMAERVVYDESSTPPNYEKKDDPEHILQAVESATVQHGSDNTHRQLKPRHIQLIGIGGTIGTALYVSIGRGLINGGPGSLFLAFTIWYVTVENLCLRKPRGKAAEVGP
jgi:amino acid permease